MAAHTYMQKKCKAILLVPPPFEIVDNLVNFDFVYICILWRLNSQTKNGHNAVHGLVLPADCAAAVGVIVPVTGASRVQASAIFLHNHSRDNVFVGLLLLCEHSQAIFDHLAGPVVYLIVLVRIATDSSLDCLFNCFAHIIHNKLTFFA